MRKMKQFTMGTAAAALVLGLAACSGAGSQTESQTEGQVQTQEQAQSQAGEQETEGNGETTEITFWHSMDSVYGEVTQAQVDLFNETVGAEKNIHVTPVFQNWPGTDALTAAMATDDIANMPDVIQLYSESINLIRDYDRTVWAEDYIGGEGASLAKEDLIPGAVAEYSIDGKLMGVPWTASALLLYYNQDYLDQAGVQVPETIDQMAQILPEITANTDAEYGLNVRINQYELENWIETQGAEGSEFGNNNNGHDGYITELACAQNGTLDKFLTEWQKVVDSGAYKPTRDSINEEFAQGMYGMVIMTSSRIPTINELAGDSFAWNVAPIPTVSADDIGGAYTSGSALFMLDREDEAKKEASWEFVQFMASPEAQVLWMEETGDAPVNVNTQELEAYQSAVEAEPRLQTAYDVLMQGGEHVIPALVPNNTTIDTVIEDAMVAFGQGSASKEDTFNAIKDGCERAIEDYYRANPIAE